MNPEPLANASPSYPHKPAPVQIILGHPGQCLLQFQSSHLVTDVQNTLGHPRPAPTGAADDLVWHSLNEMPQDFPLVPASVTPVLPEGPCTENPRTPQPVSNSAPDIAPNNLSMEYPRNPWPMPRLAPTTATGCPFAKRPRNPNLQPLSALAALPGFPLCVEPQDSCPSCAHFGFSSPTRVAPVWSTEGLPGYAHYSSSQATKASRQTQSTKGLPIQVHSFQFKAVILLNF